MPGEHAKVRASRRKITAALVGLCRREPYESVSVSAICSEAGVSRQTFYRLYGTKEAVLLHHLDELLAQASRDGDPEDRAALFKRLGALFAREREFLECLFSAGLDSYVMARFESMLREMGRATRKGGETDYLETFMAGGVFYVLRRWLLVSQDADPDEITLLLERLSDPLLQKVAARP